MASHLRARLSVYLLRHAQTTRVRLIHSPPNLPQPPAIALLGPEHEKEARAWLSSFRAAASIPKHLVDLSFSRSSGPGGQVEYPAGPHAHYEWTSNQKANYPVQNVNKLSTKVTARCRVDVPWIPLWARESLAQSPYYVKSTHSLLITSSASRSQASNVDDVLAKLHALVAKSAASLITKSPTQEQRQRVASFQKVQDARRRFQKDKQSAAKKSRSSKDWD